MRVARNDASTPLACGGALVYRYKAAWLRANPEWANALGIGSSIDMFLAHVDEDDGFVYITYALENAFGGSCAHSSAP